MSTRLIGLTLPALGLLAVACGGRTVLPVDDAMAASPPSAPACTRDGDGAAMWSHALGGPGLDAGLAVAADGAGHLWLAGTFQDGADLGGGPVSAGGSTGNLAVVQLDPDGSTRWFRTFTGAAGFGFVLGLAVDGNGDAVLGGNFQGTVDFGTGPLSSDTYGSGFLLKLAADGHTLYARRLAEPIGELPDSVSGDFVNGIAADREGNAYVTGSFTKTADFGTGPTTAVGGDVYVITLDPAGHTRWVRTFGGVVNTPSGPWPRSDEGTAIAVDGAGNVFVTGEFSGSIDFGDGHPVGPDNMEHRAFMLALAPSGQTRWSTSAGAMDVDPVGTGVTVDPSGDVIFVGTYGLPIDLGAGPLPDTPSGCSNLFVAKLSPEGALRWSHGYLGTSQPEIHVAVGPDGDVLLTGLFGTSIDFGDGPLEAHGGYDAFVAALDPAGHPRWKRSLATSLQPSGMIVRGNAIATAPGCRALVAGSFQGRIDLGAGVLESHGDSDMFVAAIQP